MRPTHSQPLVPFFQQRCPNFSSSVPTPGLPRLRDFVTAVFIVEFEQFVLSLLVSTSSRLLESCSPLLLLGTSFLLATTHFCFAAHFHHHCDYHLLPPLQIRLFLSSHSFVSPLSLTACRAFGSLHWCIYTLTRTYLRLVLPSLRPLRGLCSSCSRPAINTLLAVLNTPTLLAVLKHPSRRLETPPHFSASITNWVVTIISSTRSSPM